MKIETRPLRYDGWEDCFRDVKRDIHLCREDAKFALGLKRKGTYVLVLYTKKPKKKAKKFRFAYDYNGFRRKGEYFEIVAKTRRWLVEQLDLDDDCLHQLDGKPIWVRVKRVY